MPLFKCGRRLGLSPFRLAFPVMLTRLPHSDSGFSPMLVFTCRSCLKPRQALLFIVGFACVFIYVAVKSFRLKKTKKNSLNFVRLGKIKQVLAVFI